MKHIVSFMRNVNGHNFDHSANASKSPHNTEVVDKVVHDGITMNVDHCKNHSKLNLAVNYEDNVVLRDLCNAQLMRYCASFERRNRVKVTCYVHISINLNKR